MDKNTVKIMVGLGERSYPIYIGDGLLDDRKVFADHIYGKQVMVVTNDTVAPLFLKRLLTSLIGFVVETLIIPDGERFKTLATMNDIISALLRHKFNRDCTLIALGGGVVGDITGFAAACYQRGVNYLQIPTTLLAQVDSSVGGKTAVNHELGKNMLGAFYQPTAVLTDLSVLDTLAIRQISAGLSEIIKYGLIRDAKFFSWLEQNMQALLLKDHHALRYAIQNSCVNKVDVVIADECESGLRAILNFGHTFGHAIETELDYKDWLHGEAVACGMLLAVDLSTRLGLVREELVKRLRLLLEQINLPVGLPKNITAVRLKNHMSRDKKAKDGKIVLILLKGVGQAYISDQYDEGALDAVLEQYVHR